MPEPANKLLRVDIDKPKFDMSTYIGRAKHFFLLTNPLNILATNARLQRAREVVIAYRAGREVPYVKTIDEVWREKYLYDSAFHPETGEKMIVIGRMSAQMPCNTFLSTCMVAFYKHPAQVMFFQWLNQSFNAVVNYSNRSGTSQPKLTDLLIPYFAATFGAIGGAFGCRFLTRNMSTIFQRMTPFVAVSVANCINLPIMRSDELRNGVKLMDDKDRLVGYSRKAAFLGIAQVVMSRVGMAIPSMIFPPIVTEWLAGRGFFERHPTWNLRVQAFLVGSALIFSTPLACAFFDQRKTMKLDQLEPEVRDEIKKKNPALTEVWFNKGL